MTDAEATRSAFENELWRLTYKGRALLKMPNDLWLFTEIIEQTRPEVIVETGSHEGGSACWFADHGLEVLSVDLYAPKPADGVTFLQGPSVDLATEARSWVQGRRCMVVLDSDHNAENVLAELEAYAPLVTSGCYLVVEDTAVDRYNLQPSLYPEGGPGVAVDRFLAEHPGWSSDPRCERFGVGMNPGGWLR